MEYLVKVMMVVTEVEVDLPLSVVEAVAEELVESVAIVFCLTRVVTTNLEVMVEQVRLLQSQVHL